MSLFFLFLFSFLSAFEFLLYLLSSFFHGYFGRIIKNENFRSTSWTSSESMFIQSTDRTSFQRRDVSDMHVAIMRPSVTKLKIAKGERGRNVRWCKNRSFFCGQPCCLITHDYALFCALFRLMLSHVKNTCGIWRSVNMSLRCTIRIDVVCGDWNPISNFYLIQNRNNNINIIIIISDIVLTFYIHFIWKLFVFSKTRFLQIL